MAKGQTKMKITIEIPDEEFYAMVAKQVAAAIGDVMLRHQTQNLAAIKAMAKDVAQVIMDTPVVHIRGMLPARVVTPVKLYAEDNETVVHEPKS